MPSTRFRKISAWAGILAPVLFVGLFTLEGALRPDYTPQSMFISALSLGPRGWIQIANFMVLGVLLFLFALGLAQTFPYGKAARWGITAFYGLAALFFISGPFVMDPAGTPQDQLSMQGLIHGLAGGIVFLLMPATLFLFWRHFSATKNWPLLRGWTLALGVIEAAGVIVFTAASKIPAEHNPLSGFLGTLQRLALIPFMAWVVIFGISLLQQHKEKLT